MAKTSIKSRFRILKKTFNKWLYFSEGEDIMIDFCMAVVMSNRWIGVDSLWAYLIGPPGATKTEILRSFDGVPFVILVSNLTPSALVSGYRDPNTGEDPSLAPRLDGKTLIIKDFSTILSMHRESRDKVIGDLRDIYDGTCSKAFGNLGIVEYQSKFGLLAAVTPAIDAYYTISQQLGERFVNHRVVPSERLEMTQAAIATADEKTTMRRELNGITKNFCENLPYVLPQNISVPSQFEESVIILADVISKTRSQVTRTGASRIISFLPMAEVGTRLAQQLITFMKALTWIRGNGTVTALEWEATKKVGLDTLPAKNKVILRALFLAKLRGETLGDKEAWTSPKYISTQIHLSQETIREACEDFAVLDVLLKNPGVRRQWRLRPALFRQIRTLNLFS